MSDPTPGGSRRWTVILVLLAGVVLAGAAIRATGIDLDRAGGSSDRRDDRPAPEEGEPTPDEAGSEPRRLDEGTPGSRESGDVGAPLEGPLVIEVGQVAAIDGSPADVVRSLGPVLLDSQATLPYATSRLGEPDASGPSEDDPDLCTASWSTYDLRAWFRFGHPPSPEASCSRGPLAIAIARGAQWRVEPAGIAIGDEAALVEQALPGAERTVPDPGLALLLEAEEAYVLATGSYGGTRTPILYATIVDERIDAFAYVSNAD